MSQAKKEITPKESPKESPEFRKKKIGFIGDDDSKDVDVYPNPEESFAFFRGKSYKSVNFGEGFQKKPSQSDGKMEHVLEYLPTMRRAATSKHIKDLASEAKFDRLETPHQKITRLKIEVDEMKQVVESFLESRATGEDDMDGGLIEEGKKHFSDNPLELLKELEQLESMVSVLRNDTGFTSVFEPKPQGQEENFKKVRAMIDKLQEELDQANQEATEAPLSTNEEPSGYDFFYLPSMKPRIETSRLSETERRIHQLENLLGISTGSHVAFPQEDVFQALREICEKLLLLDNSTLTHLVKRAQDLNLQFDNLKKKELYPAVPKDNQVLRMFDFLERWRYTTNQLPSTVKRLQLLKTLHQEVAEVSTRLDTIEGQQAEMRSSIEGGKKNLQFMEELIHENIKWMKQFLETTEGRK